MKIASQIAVLALGLGTVALPAFSAATTENSAGKPVHHARALGLAKHRSELRKRVAEKLGLSADQIAQLKAKRASTAASLKAIHKDDSLTKEQKRAKAR